MKHNMVLCHFAIRTLAIFIGVCVARSSVLCVVFYISLLVIFHLVIVLSVLSLIYGFLLLLWYLQTFLAQCYKNMTISLINRAITLINRAITLINRAITLISRAITLISRAITLIVVASYYSRSKLL